MRFFNRGSHGRGNKGGGRSPNDFLGNKILHFSIHLDDEFEEFN